MNGVNLLSEKSQTIEACVSLRTDWMEAKRRAERSAWGDHELNNAYELVNDDMNELLEKLGHICMLMETGAQVVQAPALSEAA